MKKKETFNDLKNLNYKEHQLVNCVSAREIWAK